MNEKDLKYCEDCKWSRYDGDYTYLCMHPKIGLRKLRGKTVLSRGSRLPAFELYNFCDVLRDYSECGIEAKFYESRETPPETNASSTLRALWEKFRKLCHRFHKRS